MKFFAGSNPDNFLITVRRDGLRKVDDPHGGDLRDEYFPALHEIKPPDDEFNGLIQGDPEARHPHVRDRDRFPLLIEFFKQGDHASPTSHNVSPTTSREPCRMPPRITISRNEEFFRSQLS